MFRGGAMVYRSPVSKGDARYDTQIHRELDGKERGRSSERDTELARENVGKSTE